MIRKVSIVRSAAFAVMSLGSVALAAPAAQAQSLFFDWGGSESVGGSGKQSVRFPTSYKPGELVVSFGDRKIYHVTAVGAANSYPIAIPREDARWQGVTSVSDKRENPSWTPTPSMRAKNPRLPMWVPGGHPMNPLGNRAMYLGSSTYRIHGTDAPWTIGTSASSGCVRMYNQDVLDLYPKVKTGTKVTVTWSKFSTGGAAIASASDDEPTAKPKKFMRPVQARRSAAAGAGSGE